jgi:hypothetical protein
MIIVQEAVVSSDASLKARQDVFLVVFKEMVDDATQRLKQSCPELARMVREAECGR